MLKKMKLGPKFVLSLMIISMVPLAIISFTNYQYSKSELERKTIGSLKAINDSRATHINQFIQLRQEQAKAVAATYLCRQLRPDGVNDGQTIRSVQAQIESIFNELKSTAGSDYKVIDQTSTIEMISVWDIHGNIIASTNRSLIGKKEPFKFLHILYEKGAYFAGFDEDPLTGENFLTILEEIRNWNSDEYAGVVLMKFSAKALNDITTAREGLEETAESYLVDKQFRMITDSRFVKDAILNQTVRTEGTTGCFQATAVPPIYEDYRGRRVLGAQRYLLDEEWCLVTEVGVEEAFKPVTVFRNRILIVVGCLLGFILVFGRKTTREFLKPILGLRDASLKVASGDYDIEIEVQSQDEVGQLTSAFNQMTKVLKTTTDQLAEKNKILEQQKNELKRFDELKSEFVSTVSHELRTPMTIIKDSILQLLEDTDETAENDDRRMLLTMALNNIDRLAKLINNLLDLSKIEAGKVELTKEPTDMVKLARDVCLSFESTAKKKNLGMKFKVNKQQIIVDADKEKIIQVFINLIGNSMKFVEKGYIEVTVREEAGRVVCGIADTGKGIAAHDLPKVFNKFQQFGRKAGPGVKGTGLGLSICKGLVDLHGGEIWLESELGKGTTFFFTLPRKSSEGV